MTRRFEVRTHGCGSYVTDADNGDQSVTHFLSYLYPDHVSRAQQEADRLEAAHGPEWVVTGRFTLRHRHGVKLTVYASDDREAAWSAHICRLLNEHPLPEDGGR